MSVLLPIITVLIIYGIVYLIRNMNKDKLLDENKQQTISFDLNDGIEDCFQKIQNYVNSSEYTIEAIDENSYSIVLGESITLMTNGFYFPIFLTMLDENNTRIEVGIKSKSFQVGPVVDKRHNSFVNKLELFLDNNS